MSRPPRPGTAERVLAIDTATQVAVIALGDADGQHIADDRWRAGHLHGERLLASILAVLERAGSSLAALRAIAVGLGPGSFTGLRVGLATAKGLAFGLGIPIIGVETALALAEVAPPSAGTLTVVLLPAGPSGRYRSIVEHRRPEVARLAAPPAFLPADDGLDLPPGARLLALDLPAAPSDARTAGEQARRGLGWALLRLGIDRLAANGPDDLASLTPSYVTLPRGLSATGPTRTWSPELR